MLQKLQGAGLVNAPLQHACEALQVTAAHEAALRAGRDPRVPALKRSADARESDLSLNYCRQPNAQPFKDTYGTMDESEPETLLPSSPR